MKRVYVSGAFDDARSPQLRFLHEASCLGPVTLLLWPDAAVKTLRGTEPRISVAERIYYFEALRYVDKVEVAEDDMDPDRIDIDSGSENAIWALYPTGEGGPEAANPAKLSWASSRGLEAREISATSRAGFPYTPPPSRRPARAARSE